MDIRSPEFKKKDGTKVVVLIYLYLTQKIIEYRIYDIWYCEWKKRTWKSLKSSFGNDWNYKKLNKEDRIKYEIEKYVEFAGKDLLERAIMDTWESMKPDIEKTLGG